MKSLKKMEGKKTIRVKPTSNGDFSYQQHIIGILSVSPEKIVVRYADGFDQTHTLNSFFIDDDGNLPQHFLTVKNPL